MLNEWEEFLAYTQPVTYTATNKRDTTWMGRFNHSMIFEFSGLTRVLTILARGFSITTTRATC